MPKHVEPSISLVSFNCPRCGALADQSWFNVYANQIEKRGTPYIANREHIETLADIIRDSHPDVKKFHEEMIDDAVRMIKGDIYLRHLKDGLHCRHELENIFVSRCYSCNQDSLWLFKNYIHPRWNAKYQPSEDLAEEIKRDFYEAASIVDRSPRGAAALLRLCIQKLCKQAGGSGRDINTDVGRFVENGLDSRIQQALDVVRVTGNQAVHPGEMDLRDDRAIAIQMFMLVNTIADALISQPRRIQQLFDNLPEGARRAIDKRDKGDKQS